MGAAFPQGLGSHTRTVPEDRVPIRSLVTKIVHTLHGLVYVAPLSRRDERTVAEYARGERLD